MKAFTYTGNRVLCLLSRERPEVQPNTALMRIVAAAICGTDLRTYRHGSDRIRPPRVIGHEACGVIEEVGSAVKGSAPGDRVMVVPAVGCGICRWCRAGKTNMCEDLHTVGFDYDGTFADYLQIPAQAFAMGNVLLVGDAVRFVRDRTNGRGADVIITACPSGDAHEMAMQAAATRARISLLGGIPGEGQGFLNSNTIHYRELSVFGSHASTVAQNRQALDWLSAGRLDLGKHISATFPLADISAAFEALRGEKVLKVVIRPGGP